jgi:hypothetical protein
MRATIAISVGPTGGKARRAAGGLENAARLQ